MSQRLKSRQICHKLIKATAQEFAGTFYESAAHDNTFYKYYPSLRFFVDYEWGRFVPHTRQIMAQMLGRQDIAQSMKDEISEALFADRALPLSQQHGLMDKSFLN